MTKRQPWHQVATWGCAGALGAVGAVATWGWILGSVAGLLFLAGCASMAGTCEVFDEEGVRLRFGTRISRTISWAEVDHIQASPVDVRLHVGEEDVVLPTSRMQPLSRRSKRYPKILDYLRDVQCMAPQRLQR